MNAPLADAYPLTPMQQGLLFHHLTRPERDVDVEQIVCELHEPLEDGAFCRAFRRLAERHPVLRTRFRWDGGDEPVQEVLASVDVPIFAQDLRGLAEGEAERRVSEWLVSDRSRGFDLGEAPLFRVALHRTGDERWTVVWTFHHILLDGRSFPIALGELFEIYEAERQGRAPRLAERRPFRDHVAFLACQDQREAERFWRARLAGFRAATPLPGAGRRAADAPGGRGERETRLSRETTSRLEELARRTGTSLATLVNAAFALFLSRHSGEPDVVFGATRACRRSSVAGAEGMVGLLINTLPVRVEIDPALTVEEWIGRLHARERAVRAHEHAPLVEVQGWSEVAPGSPLFESLVVYDGYLLGPRMRRERGAFERRDFRLIERAPYPLTLYAHGEPELHFALAYDHPPFEPEQVGEWLGHLATLLEQMALDSTRTLAELPMLSSEEEERILRRWNATRQPHPIERRVHELIEEQAARTPDARALVWRDQALRYDELDRRAEALADHLAALGVGRETLVGVFMERSIEMVVALLGIHKAGGAYLPLDPGYPRDRIGFMLEDSGAPVVVTQARLEGRLPPHRARVVRVDAEADAIARARPRRREPGSAADLAYLIYTSGSTGRPKGVMVEHRNVAAFFAAMDERIPGGRPGTWLAVTSLSFDISVLELLWTLARGFAVVIHEEEWRAPSPAPAASRGPASERALELSLLYFASAESGGPDAYRLLLEGARYADEHGFAAVWTPERHFHAFGGLYPNPAVAGAAIASLTRRVGIRAGSVVLPLHHPARVAEEWALVDNLSRGRVGVSFASGWQPRDFVLAPERFAGAKSELARGIETVRRLWRGETVAFPDPSGAMVEIRTLPRPLQPELPVWLTSAGSVETFQLAGEIGASVLTHLLGQTLEELRHKVEVYRKAWREHQKGGDGHVTLMLHTFLDEDAQQALETAREPMQAYLRSSVGLIRSFAGEWTAFKKRADGTTEVGVDVASLAPEELDGLVAYSFERYARSSALFGSPESCADLVDRLREIGVDELAALIDFGVPADAVLGRLPQLGRLRELAGPPVDRVLAEREAESAAELIRRHGVTHLQCTPSTMRMLLLDPEAPAALHSLRVLLVGGEAFPAALAAEIRAHTEAEIVNVYGPTETTIWSSTHPVRGDEESIPIGRPIANTEFYLLDRERRPVPVGVAGELYIGGAGVARGYLGRPELTAERFVPHPFRDEPGARLYRTGDLARYRPDGAVEFLGRADQQVKVRGHRIELGEIEAALARHPAVRQCAVSLREDEPGDPRLVAYFVASEQQSVSGAELRELVRGSLPEAMVPSLVVELDALPLTPNRKIDRRALPRPSDAARPATAAFAPPDSELERRIAAIWQEVLRVPRVGLHDNFFDLGGHSLLAVKAHRALRQELGGELAITDLFRFPTVSTLAAHLGDGGAAPSLSDAHDRGALRRSRMAQRRGARVARSGTEAE
jgi:natural product biosynthesis luciferase-like monooxygenase protein